METIKSAADLKKAIYFLEIEQAAKGEQLKAQFLRTYESLKPVNLLTRNFKEVTSSPYIIDKVISTTLGLATGYFTKKLLVGASVGIGRKLLIPALQYGLKNFIERNPKIVRSIGEFATRIFSKK